MKIPKELLIFCSILMELAETQTSDKVKFYVYTRGNPQVPDAVTADVESVVRNIIHPAKPTTLALHGILGNQYAEEYAVIRDTKLKIEDGNVIVVDYSELINLSDNEYAVGFDVVHEIAESCADLILVLHRFFDMNLEHLHVVGFSFGAQIAGVVGQNVFREIGQKLPRITALDPAGGMFNENTSLNNRLSPDDAVYVEVIHTNAGYLGFKAPCGQVDYYPNGGEMQPGCDISDTGCSHIRAFQLVPAMWLPAARQELLALKCSGVAYLGQDYCRWLSHSMGDLYRRLEPGIYYVETNAVEPYGKGAFQKQFL